MKHDIRWTAEKIKHRLELIQPLIHKNRIALEPFRYQKLEGPKTEAPLNADTTTWTVIPWNSYWGTWFTDFALASTFTVPRDWSDTPIALHLPLGEAGDFSHPEVLVYVDGQIISACDRHHQELFLPEGLNDGKPHKLFLHGWTGLGGFERKDKTSLFMRECSVVRIDKNTREFVTMAQVALATAKELREDDPIKGQLLNALHDAFITLDTRDPLGEAFYKSVCEAHTVLRNGIAKSGAPLEVSVIGVGHAHIDVAWLWTLDQTRRKAGRSFSTVLKLMDEFPDYHFSQSQPQLYKYTEETYPTLFEDIKKRVSEGRWELMGGTWVEPDCNASGAESLARQFLLGIQYFREKFGQDGTPVLWLPDTFGYAWGLPQLIKEAGFKYFITHKMSWNQYNRMPFQSLWWQGLDGTKVLTHFLTTPETNWAGPLIYSTTYNGDLSPKQILGTWKIYNQKETHNELITAYGYGDGGGGPTREMLESLPYLKEQPGLPKTKLGTVNEFLERLESNSATLPTWNGEFYLEYHRGTFTSQARTKRNNRKSEFLLHDAEFLATWASLATDYAYPHQDLKRAWELVCLNQFHDILPGSSIGLVYQDSERDYNEVRLLGERVKDAALESLAATMQAEFVAVNPTSFAGDYVAVLPETLPEGKTLARSNKTVLTQKIDEGTLVELGGLEPYSLTPLTLIDGAADVTKELSISKNETGVVLENALLRVEFNLSGDITRIFDKAVNREVLAEGSRANIFQAFEDRPMMFDAWDIDSYYDDKMWEAEDAYQLEIIEDGPLRVGLEIKRHVMKSHILQRVYLYRASRRLEFDTTIDWHDQHILLKVAFPVNVLNTFATYDIQWGNVERPTHRNTSWNWANFETCAYKWVDLSEGDYGVSLLNDCKHGHDVQGNILRLTLLKSATSPDENADQGLHRVTYSLFPHEGDWRNGTVKESYALNNPVLVRSTPNKENSFERCLVKMDSPNVIIETVKRAEDDNGMIVRLYENERCRGVVTLQTGFELQEAYRCNLLEENQETLEVSGSEVKLNIRPYQIMTVRLVARA